MTWLLGNFLKWIEEGVVFVINLVIQSVADACSAMLAALPSLPTAPTLSGDILSWISYGEYWFPVSYTITLGTSMLVLWFSYLVLAIPLRWFKAIPGDE